MSLLRKQTTDQNTRIELFPVKKTQVKFCAPPEMIFFEPEEAVPDEADFIRLDDLFRIEGVSISQTAQKDPASDKVSPEQMEKPVTQQEPSTLNGPVTFMLIPRFRYQYVDAALSRIIRHSLIKRARTESKTLIFTRVRPLFIQWQLEITEGEDALRLMKAFRNDLDEEIQKYALKNPRREVPSPFWADDCMIQSAEESLSDTQLICFINRYQLQDE